MGIKLSSIIGVNGYNLREH